MSKQDSDFRKTQISHIMIPFNLTSPFFFLSFFKKKKTSLIAMSFSFQMPCSIYMYVLFSNVYNAVLVSAMPFHA